MLRGFPTTSSKFASIWSAFPSDDYETTKDECRDRAHSRWDDGKCKCDEGWSWNGDRCEKRGNDPTDDIVNKWRKKAEEARKQNEGGKGILGDRGSGGGGGSGGSCPSGFHYIHGENPRCHKCGAWNLFWEPGRSRCVSSDECNRMNAEKSWMKIDGQNVNVCACGEGQKWLGDRCTNKCETKFENGGPGRGMVKMCKPMDTCHVRDGKCVLK